MLNLGNQDFFECPVCGCDSRMEVTDRYVFLSNELNLNIFDNTSNCIVHYDLHCEECNSFFDLEEEYKMTFLEDTLETTFENHESNFSEGKYKDI